MTTDLNTNDIIEHALIGYEEKHREIEAQIAELRARLAMSGDAHAAADGRAHRADRSAARQGSRRGFTLAARNRMAKAQRKRWAAYREAQSNAKANS
jgi:hypothetical protein